MSNKRRTIINSVEDAARGIWSSIKMERNMRIHLISAIYVIGFSLFLDLTRAEFACIFVAISAVICCEMFNTSFEKLCDFNQKNRNIHIKVIKDIAAGAVFTSAIFAVCVGIVILVRPELWDLLINLLQKPSELILLLFSIAVALVFVFVGPLRIIEAAKNLFTKQNTRD